MTSKKGGSAKTTTSVNLSAALAEHNKKILVIDLDSQGHATTALGYSPYKNEKSMFDVFTDDTINAGSIAKKLEHQGLYLLPANYRMENISTQLADKKGSGFILKNKLNGIKNDYDFIIIDTPASVSLMTINALAAAEKIIIPMQQHFLSMDSLAQIIKFINKIKSKANPDLVILGILPTMVEIYTTHNRKVLNEILGHFGQKLFTTKIRKDIKIAEAPSYGQPITIYANSSKGAEDYRSLAQEVLAYEKA